MDVELELLQLGGGKAVSSTFSVSLSEASVLNVVTQLFIQLFLVPIRILEPLCKGFEFLRRIFRREFPNVSDRFRHFYLESRINKSPTSLKLKIRITKTFLNFWTQSVRWPLDFLNIGTMTSLSSLNISPRKCFIWALYFSFPVKILFTGRSVIFVPNEPRRRRTSGIESSWIDDEVNMSQHCLVSLYSNTEKSKIHIYLEKNWQKVLLLSFESVLWSCTRSSINSNNSSKLIDCGLNRLNFVLKNLTFQKNLPIKNF